MGLITYKETRMFIESIYALTESGADKSIFGYDKIVVKDRFILRTEKRDKDDSFVPGDTVCVTSYFYTLLCAVGRPNEPLDDCVMIDQDELHEEVMAGYYQLTLEVEQI